MQPRICMTYVRQSGPFFAATSSGSLPNPSAACIYQASTPRKTLRSFSRITLGCHNLPIEVGSHQGITL